MKKNTKNKIILITIGVIVLALVAYIIIYLIKNDKSYTHTQKKWISENANNVVDVYVDNTLPVFSNSGNGVFYDYLSALEKDIDVSFNIVNEGTKEYSMKLSNNDSNALTFYKDHYVVISKTNSSITSLNDLKGKTVGILLSHLDVVKQYLSDYQITYKGYGTFDDLKVAFTSKDCDYAIVPLYLAINDIIRENYIINYHIDGFNAYYVLNLSPTNNELNGIMQKFYDRWSKKANEKRNEYLVDLYYKAKNYTEIQKSEIISDDYNVGYLNNLPFEGTVNNTFTGLTSAYLTGFSELSGVTYKYHSYKSIDDLILALNEGKLDIVANYYSTGANGYINSNKFITKEYVVLTHADNPLTIETLSTLSNSNVEMLSRMNLTSIMKTKGLFKVKEYQNSKELFKNINKDSIIIVEKELYEYYKNDKFKNFVIKYSNSQDIENSFLLKGSNTSLNKLFDFYLTLNSDSEMMSRSTQKLYSDARNNIILSFILNNIIYIILVLGVGSFVAYKLAHKIRISKRIKKEDKLLYIDVMTNLKNRNYLNDNIEYWSENKVYPQAILILDLNQIKDLNDKYGHEEGDKQIKAAANVLIKTQRENSEIMRTDGNEFMVYLVGYEEKIILSYIHKLTRELNLSLPYKNYGASLGYAMIENELNTIDDAINDATNRMRANKEGSSEK